MKKYALVFIFICALMTAGCAKTYDSISAAEAAGEVLGENIFIDGVDVSLMSVSEARAAVNAAHDKACGSLKLCVIAGDGRAEICGSDVPTSYDTDDVLLRALNLKKHYPAGNPARELFCTMRIDDAGLFELSEDLAESLYEAPVNASAEYERGEGFVYDEHEDGISADKTHIASHLKEAVSIGASRTINAKTTAVPAQYTTDMAKYDTQLIAEFTTSFKGSTYGKKNRVFNIVKAASLINGVTVGAGENFSMNAVLGARNGENGWREATGIRDGKYVQEYGGGVCQVSTTLYNALLMAELEITERHHHSWPLGYVDIGRDATISTGGPDLKFKNQKETPVTVTASVDEDEKTVTVRIYGRPLDDGVTIKLKSKKVSSIDDPGDEYVLDAALPYGTEVVDRESRAGSVAETYKLYYDADGELIEKKLVTRDKYKPIKGRIMASYDVYHAMNTP